jgi:hypothetical protein
VSGLCTVFAIFRASTALTVDYSADIKAITAKIGANFISRITKQIKIGVDKPNRLVTRNLMFVKNFVFQCIDHLNPPFLLNNCT